QTSAAAANRTSTGNGTVSPVCRNQVFTARSAGTTAWAGSAYSISRNRTRRGVANTSWEGAVYRRADSARAATQFTFGVSAFTPVHSRLVTSNTVLERISSSSTRRTGLSGPAAPARLFALVSTMSVYGNQ